jgi:hypothetical protein
MSTLDARDAKQPISTAASFTTSSALQAEDLTPKELTAPGHPHILTRLSNADLNIVCHSIGGTQSTESQSVIHPTSWIYPPKGLPDGLYKDVVRARVGSQYSFYICSAFFNINLVLQLVLGALLTALGSRATGKDVLITVLAAANTINAGLLALMHNSGLPDRYQKDWAEFEKVEMFMRELMDTGIVRKDMTRDEIIENCYANFRKARDTIQKNQPASYTMTEGGAAPVSDSRR